LYVDDVVAVERGQKLEDFRVKLRSHFNITARGSLNWYLGIAFEHLKDGSIT
jgi:hypothetical protein